MNFDFYDSILVKMTHLDQISGHLSIVKGALTIFIHGPNPTIFLVGLPIR